MTRRKIEFEVEDTKLKFAVWAIGVVFGAFLLMNELHVENREICQEGD